MKRLFYNFGMLAVAASMFAACADGAGKKAEAMEFDNKLTEAEKQAGVFTPEIMWKMGRVGSPTISPDGTQVIYTVTYYNLKENKGVTSLWLVPFEGGESVQVTDNAGSDNSPVWSADGKSVYFFSTRSGDGQIWKLDVASKAITQLSNVEGGIDGYGIAPAENRVFYAKQVHVSNHKSSDVYPAQDKSNVLIYDDLMARHWDYWDKGDYYHIFVADIENGKVGEGKDIMPDEAWDSPLAPYFDMAEIAWNNAGTQLAYTCKKLKGKDYALSTDSDIYIYDVAAATTENITKGMVGYDKYPVFSPDDSKVAFQSQERAGNESDKSRLFVHDLASGQKSYLTEGFDYNAANVKWESEGSILFLAPMQATYQICRVGMEGNVEVLTAGDHDIVSFTEAGGKVVADKMRMDHSPELYTVNLADGAMAQITDVNAEVFDNIKMGGVQKRWVATTDGKEMLVWVVTPPDFDPAKKYPVLLYCQGGPQSVVSQFWSFRWNFMIMSAKGYIVVAPNRRGLPSFGQEWLDQISGDYPGQNMRDYLSAIDDVAKEPWADENRMGCIGASYGGYSVYFLAGHHQKRFKAFVSHCGIFNCESMYGSTEELFFLNNDYGGPYWDTDNQVAQRTYANSPHKFVKKWDAPILITTGFKDYRVPYAQSLEAFTAARMLGLPAKLVAFEDEAHQVFKPQNNMVWNAEFFGWLDKYVKDAE